MIKNSRLGDEKNIYGNINILFNRIDLIFFN